MIHDILLSCLSLTRKGVGIRAFLVSNAVEDFMHPCEREIFIKILNILNNLNDVVRFSKHFTDQISDFADADEYSSGSYLKSFAQGVENALEDYYNEILRLESVFEKRTPNSLLFFYTVLELQLPVVLTLRKLIADAKIQKLHGCALVQAINLRCEQGDANMDKIIAKVAKPLKLAFYSHLAQWLLFGMIDDPHSEFFITYKPPTSNGDRSCKRNSITNMSISEEVIWQYEINMIQVPSFVSTTLAEQILFVGQTVLVFKLDQSKNKHNKKIITLYRDDIGELWDGNEGKFYKMIEDLNEDDKIDVHRLKSVIIEIKEFVSTRLSAIAVIEDDLDRQMGLIKDFYLLGRGEFYFEFLRQLYGTLEDHPEVNAKNYTRAFEMASNCLGITDDLEHFSLSINKPPIDLDESCEFTLMQNLQLKYKYKWPLNLLFSPTIVERYNTIFQFLLIVRKLQYDLQLVWARHKWIIKKKTSVNIKVINFRNLLMFFMDNLQYYIQVDVLESQFSIFVSVIKRKADFEEIQRAHSIFLANVLSQCFLLTNVNEENTNITQTKCSSQYSIYGTILEIFRICEKFSLMDCSQTEHDDDFKEIERLEERFNVSILALMKLLINIKSASSFGSLSQFLLRLDYNRWFSAKLKPANISSDLRNI